MKYTSPLYWSGSCVCLICNQTRPELDRLRTVWETCYLQFLKCSAPLAIRLGRTGPTHTMDTWEKSIHIEYTWQRERQTQTDRRRERDRDTETETDRQTDRDTETQCMEKRKKEHNYQNQLRITTWQQNTDSNHTLLIAKTVSTDKSSADFGSGHNYDLQINQGRYSNVAKEDWKCIECDNVEDTKMYGMWYCRGRVPLQNMSYCVIIV